MFKNLVKRLAYKVVGEEELKKDIFSKFNVTAKIELASELDESDLIKLLEESWKVQFNVKINKISEDPIYRKKVLDIELKHLLERCDFEDTYGWTITRLIKAVREVEESNERNILKRKSMAVKAIKERLPKIGKADCNYAVELLLQVVKYQDSKEISL